MEANPTPPEKTIEERIKQVMEVAGKIDPYQVWLLEKKMENRRGFVGTLIFYGVLAVVALIVWAVRS